MSDVTSQTLGHDELESIDNSRRTLLLGATVALGATGVVFTAIPFIESWLPSESARALGAPTEIDLSKLEPGQMVVSIWRRQPILVVRRTPQMLSLLGNHDDRLKDPTSSDSNQPPYCKNPLRARTGEFLVLIGVCTHLGCLPKPRFDAGDPQLGADWPGGWACPCHGSRFDLAGRVFDGSPASVNLVIPPYAFPNPQRVVIGLDSATETAAAPAPASG
jgi:ubiquinol-cytochrome c reductase iron-sulfur subunit